MLLFGKQEKARIREANKKTICLTAEEPQYLGTPFDLGEPMCIEYCVEDTTGQHRRQHYDGDRLDHAFEVFIENGTVASILRATAHFRAGQQLSCFYLPSGQIWSYWS